jgi:hypothetical protein
MRLIVGQQNIRFLRQGIRSAAKRVQFISDRIKGKVVPVLNRSPYHEDVISLIKYNAMMTYSGMKV